MKPVLILLTLPINILTLGLFTFVINAALVFIASYLVPGFFVTSLLSAIIFSLMVSLINSFLNLLAS
jgi:putative membrane protein